MGPSYPQPKFHLILFHPLVPTTNRFYKEGYASGYDHGRIHGLIEGKALGCEKGFELFEEVAFCQGFATLIIAATRGSSDTKLTSVICAQRHER